MEDIQLFFSKYIFPILLIVIGLALILSNVAGGQNLYFLWAGIFILLVGGVSIVLMMDKVPNMVQNILVGVFLLAAVITGYFAFKSIQEPVKFKQVQKKRYAKVIKRLKDIREVQIAYRTVYGSYAGSFDTLLTFINQDSFPVIKAEGFVPDTLTEKQAVELGIVSRDTSMISVRDSLFSPKFPVDSLQYVPYGSDNKIELAAGKIERGNVMVPVFEAIAKNEYIFRDWPEHYYINDDDLKVGSMEEPSTSGNWE